MLTELVLQAFWGVIEQVKKEVQETLGLTSGTLLWVCSRLP